MKKLSILFAALMMCALSFADETYTYTFSKAVLPTEAPSADIKLNGITWKQASSGGWYSGYDNTKGQQIGSSSQKVTAYSLTTSEIAGTIKKIVVNASMGKDGGASLNVKVGDVNYIKTTALTTTATDYEGTGSSGGDIVISFTNTKKKAFYIKSISITYTDAVASVEKPTFTVTEGSADADGFYENNLQLTLACATEGATIRYTLDGTEPTAVSAEYTTALSFTNEFVTLQAKAFKGEDESYAVTAQYYHKSTADLPYSTTEALKLYTDKGAAADIYVAGTVTEATPYTSSGTTNYTITDGTNTLNVYKGKADATSGLEDILTLIEGDKVVVKGSMSIYNSTPQIGEGSTIVKWTENTNPVLTVLKDAIDFGGISMYATAPKKTITVTGKNLTEDITATLSDNAAFMVDKTTLPATGGEIVVTPNMEALGENTATLTLTSGEKSVVVSLSSEILLANLISWSANGTVTATTDVIDGEALVLPADPETPSACSNKTFMGWATDAIVNADGTDITWVNAQTIPTADATYYAVFALVTESTESTTATIDFSKQGYEDQQDFEGVKLAIDKNVSATFAKSESSKYTPKYYDNGTAIRLYAGGTLTISSVTTMSKVEITFDKKENALTSDVEKWDNDKNIWEGSAKEIVLTESGDSGNNRFQTISITYNTATMSDYATICNGTSTDMQDAAAPKAQTIVKTIENGQLVIVIDGTRYNAQGQVIE